MPIRSAPVLSPAVLPTASVDPTTVRSGQVSAGATTTPAPPRPEGGESSTVRAPDGMERNAVVRESRLSRADVIARARQQAPVPQRVQLGPTCGLYALGMVMDAWHRKDPKNITAIVQDQDLRGRGKQFTLDPNSHERILDVARDQGFTAQGEMFTASQLATLARHFGYDATTHANATLDDLYKVLDAGHPAIVAFDVDYNGNPTATSGGERAHYAVIQGYFDDNGTRYLVARHGWGVQQDHVWRAADFDASWKALQTTTYYGTPGDGEIPNAPGLREPARMALPDAGGGRARIDEALGTKIVEVVPRGEPAVGGRA
jgi:hypothetical protein